MWEPVTSGDPSDEAFVARCLLGAGWVGANRKLSMLDLRIWAALCAALRDRLPSLPSDDLTLANEDTRTVETTGYQLADMVFAQDGGNRYLRLRRSLVRLAETRACVQVIERDRELAVQQVREGYVSLVGDIWLATTRLNLSTPRQWGSLKGSTSLKVEIGRWPAQQVLAGHCTWLDLDLLRALGTGLSARLWAALEAWGRWPARSLDGREECAIGLGKPALQSLGVAQYERQRDARRALDRAGRSLIATDPAYELIRCERRGGGWCLVVRRVCGARSRAEARKQHGTYRDPGTAAKTQQRRADRAKRVIVRNAIRRQLGEASDDPSVDVDELAA
jgi:hypothetical protein